MGGWRMMPPTRDRRQGANRVATATTEVSHESTLGVLRRLLTAPDGQRVTGTAARRTLDALATRGLIELDGPDSRRVARLTDAGRAFLVASDNPRVLLEDLLRAIEQQSDQLRDLETAFRQQRNELAHHHARIADVLMRVKADHPAASPAATLFSPELVRELLESHARSGHPGACSIDVLFHGLRERCPSLTIGQFHDGIRAMHDAGMLRLGPWTGPLYQIAEPALALLIGHEVLYYVDLARRDAL